MLPLLLGDNRGVIDGLVGCAGVFDCRISGVCPKELKRCPFLYIPKLMNRIKSKPVLFFCISENKGADQRGSERTADRCLCLRCNLSNLWFEISSLCACHVAVEPGFCQNWAEVSKTGFIVMRFKQYGMLLI